jgi:hypothetical protein
MRPPPRIAALVAVASCVVGLVQAPVSAGTPAIVRDPANPSYVVALRTGPKGHVWAGVESLAFTNRGTTDLTEIWLRLWSNGVRGCGGVDGRDAIEVSAVEGGTPDAPKVRCTAMRIQLDVPVPPNARGSVSMHVRIALPAANDRFGYHRGLALLGTALPTLAVRDDQGWHDSEPFVDLGESFYSIAGDYRVTLTTPEGLDTVATGLRVAHAHLSGRRVRSTYAARRVRDFAWAAGHLAKVTGQLGTIRVVVSYQRAGITDRQARAALATTIGSMRIYGADFGRYPYAEMDVVLTAFATFGGMEYPTIVFTNPAAIEHEVAHQWWYGIVGNDEFHEPWLDEGFATWTERLAPGSAGPWTRCTSSGIWPNATASLTQDMSYWASHGSYYTLYYAGGCLLANLAHRFGLKRFIQVLRGYAQAHWFGVARTSEFRAAIEDAAAADGVPGIGPAYWARWRVD